MALARTCRAEIRSRINHHHLLPPAATTTPRPCLPMPPMFVLGRIGPRPAPLPQRPNRHRQRRTLRASSPRGFLPWRLADASPRARGNVRDGPASATRHRNGPPDHSSRRSGRPPRPAPYIHQRHLTTHHRCPVSNRDTSRLFHLTIDTKNNFSPIGEMRRRRGQIF
jgi:hypothetical protein